MRYISLLVYQSRAKLAYFFNDAFAIDSVR